MQSFFERDKTSAPEGDINFYPRTVGEMFLKLPGDPQNGEPKTDISIVRYVFDDATGKASPDSCHVSTVYPRQ